MTRTGERETGAVSVRLPDKAGVLACMRGNVRVQIASPFRLPHSSQTTKATLECSFLNQKGRNALKFVKKSI